MMSGRTQHASPATSREVFASEVREYLERTPRQLPSKYLYDELGSSLFEAICRLPWYRITRAESSLLAKFAKAILQPLHRPLSIAELGCGSGEKLAILTANGGEPTAVIQLVDISAAALDMAQYRLEAIGYHNVLAHQTTYEEGLIQIARSRPPQGSLILLFLGSNLGNFDPPVARDLLCRMRSALRTGDALLLGSDLVKPERDLLLAYDDPLEVTAAFNRNLLRRINDELDATFDLAGFAHRALWNRAERRVEMRLVSLRRQTVEIGAAEYSVTFQRGEEIWTESSHKYEVDQVVAEGRGAGFDSAQQWLDEDARFVLTRFMVDG
jgi:L-histidine Nalpha-methyltransferase